MIKRHPIIEQVLSCCVDVVPIYEVKILSSVDKIEKLDVFGEVEEVSYSDPSLCSQFISIAMALWKIIKKGDYLNAQKIFTAIENVLETADDDLKGEIEVCFFEGIMNVLSNQEEDDEDKIDKDRLYCLLGPISRELCRQNDEFWGTKIF